MAKWRGYVVQVMEMREFDSKEKARTFGIDMRDHYQEKFPKLEFYFEVDDCGSEEEEE